VGVRDCPALIRLQGLEIIHPLALLPIHAFVGQRLRIVREASVGCEIIGEGRGWVRAHRGTCGGRRSSKTAKDERKELEREKDDDQDDQKRDESRQAGQGPLRQSLSTAPIPAFAGKRAFFFLDFPAPTSYALPG